MLEVCWALWAAQSRAQLSLGSKEVRRHPVGLGVTEGVTEGVDTQIRMLGKPLWLQVESRLKGGPLGSYSGSGSETSQGLISGSGRGWDKREVHNSSQ